MSDSSKILLLAQLTSTLSMTGLIWFVQISHYPLFAAVGQDCFAAYERAHRLRTTIVVAPLMLTEAATTVMLFFSVPDVISLQAAMWGAALLLTIWGSTAALQVPQHERLSKGFQQSAWRWLVLTNWIRTIAWTARSGILLTATWPLLK